MRIFCFEKNICLNSIKNDHADDCRSGCGLIRSILGILELSSEKNHTFITIWESWFSYEFPLLGVYEPRTTIPNSKSFPIPDFRVYVGVRILSYNSISNAQ